jgi:hypothetical protein
VRGEAFSEEFSAIPLWPRHFLPGSGKIWQYRDSTREKPGGMGRDSIAPKMVQYEGGQGSSLGGNLWKNIHPPDLSGDPEFLAGALLHAQYPGMATDPALLAGG